ncbi:hypothetical protein [Ollibium composti]|uniref:Uncharacterized protein n=1 Tax=Ollibium composti TaxID=2675109 RepID=A0ABY2Q8E9_9HYPH|nr:hypothetical protein [Mesorhizobium composti]THF58144.1 hypothetical protein E6C48_05865 [Mesorhizobium composti]
MLENIVVNAFDQMRSAFLEAYARFGPVPAPEPGIDWSTWVTAAATVVLAITTGVLFWETRRMREASERIHRDSREPHFIIYTQIDEVEQFADIVFENVTDNPAYDVEFRFVPDRVLDVYKRPNNSDRINPRLSQLGFDPLSVVAPRQKIIRNYSKHTNETGVLKKLEHFSGVNVHVSFSSLNDQDKRKTEILTLDTSHNNKAWRKRKNTLIALQEQTKESTKLLARMIFDATAPDRIGPSSGRIKDHLEAPRKLRPVRDRLHRPKRRPPSS